MISSKGREIRRGRTSKMSKNLERAYRERKCRECTVVVTRMDFAKILGKFTKVKIQYESCSTSKTKQTPPATSPNSNARLKSNENGMVLIHRNAYSQHPVKELITSKKLKTTEPSVRTPLTPRSPRPAHNVLKENNRQKKTVPDVTKENSTFVNRRHCLPKLKEYGVIFVNPVVNNSNDKNKTCLQDLLPFVNKSILPSDEWCIDYFPKSEEPKDDKVYDRIAAELEDLMYNEKKDTRLESKNESIENSVDDFPSIMDILNDNSTETNFKENESDTLEPKPNLESSDVEAMLLGKSNETNKVHESTMDVDNNEIKDSIDMDKKKSIEEPTVSPEVSKPDEANKADTEAVDDNPNSPSILDEALQKGIEEHLPTTKPQTTVVNGDVEDSKTNESTIITEKPMEIDVPEEPKPETNSIEDSKIEIEKKEDKTCPLPHTDITHIVFNNMKNGICIKSVTCPKNLKYTIELNNKAVELIGAPKFISSLDDLQVLLQIVNDTELESLHVFQLAK